MCKNIIIIASIAVFIFSSCSSNRTDVQRLSLKSQVLNDEIFTMMPGDLLLADDYLVWSDPFA